MRCFFVSLLFFIITTCSKNDNNYKFEATVKGLKDSAKVFLFDYGIKKVIDSTWVINERFSFDGKLKNPTNAAIAIDKTDIIILFWLEKGKMRLYTDVASLEKNKRRQSKLIRAGLINRMAVKFNENIDLYLHQKLEIYQSLKDSLISEHEYDRLMDSYYEKQFEFLLKYPNNYFSLSKIFDLKPVLPQAKLLKYYQLLKNDFKNSPKGKLLKGYLDIKENARNNDFIEIIGKNINGESVKLSDFRGKIVLLNFWASWCSPCIKHIKQDFPMIKKRYKNSNLQLVSFSFDDNKASWVKFSKKLNMDWTNLSNLTEIQNSQIAFKYNVYEIPTSFILGLNGEILKRVENNEDLIQELDNVLFLKDP